MMSVQIAGNTCFALLGLNGAGKATLINMLSTIIAPSSGSTNINGFDLVKDYASIRKIINISPQENAVAKNLTVRENLDLIATLYNIENKEKRISDIITEFKLEEKTKTRCKKLSGGQMCRVSLALGIITEPIQKEIDEKYLKTCR